MSVNDGGSSTSWANNSYDVELLARSTAQGSGFDLAALYNAASTPTHIRNVLIEGNLAPYASDASQIGIGGQRRRVQLPLTALAGVGIMGNTQAGSVNAASVQAVSFASITEPTCWGTITVPASTGRGLRMPPNSWLLGPPLCRPITPSSPLPAKPLRVRANPSPCSSIREQTDSTTKTRIAASISEASFWATRAMLSA